MPGIVLFNRILPLASDDISIPAFLLFTLHLIGFVFALSTSNLSFVCPSGEATAFIPLFIAVFISLSILDLLIFYISLQGTVANGRPRAKMTFVIYIYLFVSLLDIATAIVGSVGLQRGVGQCENTDNIPSFLSFSFVYHLSLTYQWIEIVLVTLAIGLLFLASVQNRVSLSERHHHVRRFIAPLFYASTTMSQSRSDRVPEPQAVLKSVATLLTDLFSSVNLCLSDVVVGLVLVRQRYLAQIDINEDVVGSVSVGSSSDSSSIFNLSKIAYFSKYAEAMYGVPLFIFADTVRGIGYMCCPCLPSQENRSPVDAIEKTMEQGWQTLLCCFPGTWRSGQSHHPDLLYKSIQGRMFKSPFAVSRDRNTNTIVISVRGTLSTADLLVDLYIEEQQIEWTDEEGGRCVGFVHGGMLEIARSILKELEESRTISLLKSELFSHMEIICAGHSLGAGVSALLAFLIRTSEPYRDGIGRRTSAICYSSPGFLISASAIPFFRTFCTSVVLGEDFVCRINPNNTQDLKESVYAELQSCHKRKIDILSTEIINQLFNRKKNPSREPLLKADTQDQSGESSYPIDARIYNGTKLYIPGNVLHLQEKNPEDAENNNASASSSNQLINPASDFVLKWIDPIKLGERIIVSDKMLVHHLPNRVGDALRSTIRISL